MSVFLTDKIPYVRLEHVPGASGVGVLPFVFGDCRAVAIPTARLSGQRYAVAGHPMQITAVRVDGKLEAASASVVQTSLGQPVTVVDFNRGIDPAATVEVYGLGLRRADGALIEQVGDVLTWLYALAGVEPQMLEPETEAGPSLSQPSLSQPVAGVLADESMTVRAAIFFIASHAAAMVCGPVVLPVAVTGAPRIDLSGTELLGFSADYTLADQYDSVGIGFDGAADATPRQHVLALSGLGVPQAMRSLRLPWLRSAAAAEAAARAWYAWLGARRLRLNFDAAVPLAAGTWVRLRHPALIRVPGVVAVDGLGSGGVLARIMAVDMVSGMYRYSAVAPLHPAPEATTKRLRGATASTTGVSATLALNHGTATITIEAPDGRLLVGAKCRLDDGPTQRSDQRGQVSFVARPGTHQLHVEADGYAPFVMEVTL